MEITVLRDPFCIVAKNVFGEKSKLFMREILKNKNNFEEARVGGENGRIDKEKRDNIVAYYDVIYNGKRHMSPLLLHTQNFLKSEEINNLLSSAPYPLSLYPHTNYHETQVSRYGSNQKYDWHVDPLSSPTSRIITFSYYLTKTPKKWDGGQIVLSNGLLFQKNVVGETNRHMIEVENDMLVVFASTTLHCVMPTKSPENFEDGRFSVQMWLGIHNDNAQNVIVVQQKEKRKWFHL